MQHKLATDTVREAPKVTNCKKLYPFDYKYVLISYMDVI